MPRQMDDLQRSYFPPSRDRAPEARPPPLNPDAQSVVSHLSRERSPSVRTNLTVEYDIERADGGLPSSERRSSRIHNRPLKSGPE